MEKILVIGDVHIPFQDNHAIEIAIAVGRDVKPDRIVFNGDMADFPNISSHFAKNPSELEHTARGQCVLLVDFIKRIRSEFGDIPIDYVYGNHEYRFDSYIWEHAPAMADMEGLNLSF